MVAGGAGTIRRLPCRNTDTSPVVASDTGFAQPAPALLVIW